jgi:uncharacterized membrane protein YebE (DUF533 family)
MNADQEKRILVTVHWVSNEIFRFKGELLQPETMLNIAKAFMEIAAADGSLNDAERKWIVGYAAATGKNIFQENYSFTLNRSITRSN